MTGLVTSLRRCLVLPVLLVALSACEDTATANIADEQQAAMLTRSEQDVERPDLFSATDRGLWDGRPSLGGIWVAHPDVSEPERVIIRNTATGQSTIGALFRRERENPGPLMQLSSDAADALGILPGAPTELNVVALRREEVALPAAAVEVPTDATALPGLPEISATPLEPAGAAAADPVAVAVPPTSETAAIAPVSAAGLPPAPLVQVGVFSQQANADTAAASLQSAGFTAAVIALQRADETSWRVVAGPVPDQSALARVQALGFADAYFLPNPS